MQIKPTLSAGFTPGDRMDWGRKDKETVLR